MNLDLTLAIRIAGILKQREETVAVVESSAGGLISSSLLAIPGASRYFLGGAVVYTTQARSALMGIEEKDMAGMRSASEPYAQSLADRIRVMHGATWGLAETGASGPTGNRYGDAAGHTCISIAGPTQFVETLETHKGDREMNMLAFTEHALGSFESVLLSAS